MRKLPLFPLLFIAISFLIVGCGTRADAAPSPGPNKLHIVMHPISSAGPTGKDIDSSEQVQKIYNHINALPAMKPNQICTLQAGPTYDLTFSKDGATLLTAKADSGGCGTVKLSDNDTRLADKEFWQMLNGA